MKCIRPEISVGEDSISSSTGFTLDRVFSTVDNKSKVLASRRGQAPFPSGAAHRSVRVGSQVVIPSDTRINFKHSAHSRVRPVQTLADTLEKYQRLAREQQDFNNSVLRREIRSGWISYRDVCAKSQRRTPQHLGRFAIRRQLSTESGVYEYFAVDEPPCQMEVLLREFPYDPALPAGELDRYIQEVARETRVLMRVRHPSVACVVGHFQTGASWVQVSDWFEGERLENLWSVLAGASVWEKMGIFAKTIQALEFCHEKGVLHRNLGAKAIRVSQDLSEIRLTGFDCALDPGSTLSTSTLQARRDPRSVAPEDLASGKSSNPRLSDIFQAGLLLYRLLENGNWPFADTLDYVTSGGALRPFSQTPADLGTEILQRTALQMMDLDPRRRPDLLRKVEFTLEQALAEMTT